MAIFGNTKRFVSEKLRRGKINRAHDMVSVSKTWGVLLGVTAAVAVCGAAFSFFLFTRISSGEIFNVIEAESAQPDTIDRALLDETISFYENKSLNFEQLKKSRPSVNDPSL
jgi:hypothetical protein